MGIYHMISIYLLCPKRAIPVARVGLDEVVTPGRVGDENA